MAKYIGPTWRRNDSGDFEPEDTSITRAGNTYLRYYLGEAANNGAWRMGHVHDELIAQGYVDKANHLLLLYDFRVHYSNNKSEKTCGCARTVARWQSMDCLPH